MGCNGTCHRIKAKKPLQGSYYEISKRCQECGIFILWKGVFCPCCGMKLRTKPRNNEYKNKLREQSIKC